MRHRASADFWKRFRALPAETQVSATRQFDHLNVNPSHPSLQFKKIIVSGNRELWSARATIDYRALAIKTSDGYLWFWIGDHKEYDRLIG